jgi:hypothetical protein
MLRVERVSAADNLFEDKDVTYIFRDDNLIAYTEDNGPVKRCLTVDKNSQGYFVMIYLNSKLEWRIRRAAYRGDERAEELLYNYTTLYDDGVEVMTYYPNKFAIK